MNPDDQASYRFVIHNMTKAQRRLELKNLQKQLRVLS